MKTALLFLSLALPALGVPTSSLTPLTTPAAGDLLNIVDISDTTMAATGSNKSLSWANLFNGPMLIAPILGTPVSGNFSSGTFTWPQFNQSTTGYSSALKTATTTVDVAAATAPTTGQVLTSTDSTHAIWATPTTAASALTGTTLPAAITTATGLALSGGQITTGTVADARLASALIGKTYNGLTITTTTGTLTVASGTTMTFPATTAALARTDAAQTFTGAQTFTTPISVASGGSGLTAQGRVGAWSSSDQVLTMAAWNKLLFQTEEEDTGNNFASSTFTAPAACHVIVDVGIYKSAGVTGVDGLAIYRNGSASIRLFTKPVSVAESHTASQTVKCAASDTLEIYYYAQSSTTIGTAQLLTRVVFSVVP